MNTNSKNLGRSGLRIAPLVIACVIVVGSGVIHGLILDRWGTSDDLNQAVASLKEFPVELGNWKSQESTISEGQLEIGEIDGYLSRVYTNQEDGSSVSMMIVCGRPGPISVHTPDICFKGAGYQMMKQPERHHIATKEETSETGDTFFADFAKPVSSESANLRVFWTWSDGRQFLVPDSPRIAFAGKSFLYKIYLTRAIDSFGDPPDKDQCVSFFKLAIPVLQRTLFSGPKPEK